MALTGSICGVLLANWLGGALRWLLPGVARPVVLAPPLDGQVFAFTAALAVSVAVLAGLLPALHSSRANINEALNRADVAELQVLRHIVCSG